MGHATAQDIFDQLIAKTAIPFTKIEQLSMDGPNGNWKVHSLLSCHIEVPTSTTVPLDYRPHRWVENVTVAERAIAIWPDIQLFFKSLKPLSTKSYKTLAEMMQDKLLTARAQCFISIAKDVEPFLLRFQSGAPLRPFLGSELSIA
ncbi:DNA-dependent protein kinase catalytic subunit-like protein [Elysia marginata]|uniref:DNA-dependent protein kinase catalytic subunit-like protein n=1 Tax=Elysia marginata TaxID=1093978 RepID=A0AAV4JRB3_9GAST|nr:DNA-dependent protein kinase catalytic subunit-like protein [Elysia marginata]